MLLKNTLETRKFLAMKHRIISLAAAAGLALITSSAAADCTAEYKAKQDNPLRLEHGTISVSGPCIEAAATPKVEAALAARGWTLLKVLTVSGN